MKPTVKELRQLGDFQTELSWAIEVMSGPAQLMALSRTLNARCEEFEKPTKNGSKVTLNIREIEVHQPGTQKFTGSSSFTFAETVDNVVKRFIKEWRDICWDSKTGIARPKAEVECVVKFTEYNRGDTPIKETILYGVFLETANDGSTSNSAEITKPGGNLSWDYYDEVLL